MTKVLVSVDYDDDSPVDWKVMETSLPSELEEIYNYAVKHKYAPSSSKALKDYLPTLRCKIEEKLIEEMINEGDSYVIDLCGGRTATTEEIIDAVANRDYFALVYYGLENATNEEIESWDGASQPSFPRLRDIYESYSDKSPFNEGWKLTVKYYDPAVEEH
ncbi:MAG: hypothetical protein IJA43_08275 [Clostridia bacterium]|nr:hypothetical protein [Clostridia bacterium]